jgi:hypothetical protein
MQNVHLLSYRVIGLLAFALTPVSTAFAGKAATMSRCGNAWMA